jgi:hypothetical protein
MIKRRRKKERTKKTGIPISSDIQARFKSRVKCNKTKINTKTKLRKRLDRNARLFAE